MVTRCLYAFVITAAIISSVSCTPSNQPYDEPLLYPVAQYVDSLGGVHEAPLDLRWLFRVSTKWGYIDTAGNQIIPPIFDYASHFREGRAMIRKDGRFGFIDESGGGVIEPIYSRATLFSEGLSAVTYPDSSIIFIDKDNIPKIGLPFARGASAFSEGRAVFQHLNLKFGAINRHGEVVVQPKFDMLDNFAEGVARFWIDNGTKTGLHGFIDEFGNIKIDPQPIEFRSFSNERALAFDRNINKYGYIDSSGELVIPTDFDSAFSFSDDGLARVHRYGKWGYISKTGELRIEHKYERAFGFNDGIAVVSLDGKLYGAINIKGEWVVPPVYSKLGRFHGPLAAIQDPKTGAVSFVNRRGDPITNDAFAECLEFPNPYRHFPNTFYIETDKFDATDIVSSVISVGSIGLGVNGFDFYSTTYAEVKESIRRSSDELPGYYGELEIFKQYYNMRPFGDFTYDVTYNFVNSGEKGIITGGFGGFREYPNATLNSVFIQFHGLFHLEGRIAGLELAMKTIFSDYLGTSFQQIATTALGSLKIPMHAYERQSVAEIAENGEYKIVLIRNFKGIGVYISKGE
jgi:hypothetical protein